MNQATPSLYAQFDLNTLQELQECGILTATEVASYQNMRKEKKVLSKHPYAINVRNDGRYVTKIKVNGTRKQLLGKTQEELINKLYEHYFGMESFTLAQTYAEYLLFRRDHTAISPKTIQEYQVDWRKFLENSTLAEKPIAHILPLDIKRFFQLLTKERAYTKQRIVNIRSLLNGIFDYAVELERISQNPVKLVNFKYFSYKVVDNRKDVFKEQERNTLLEYLTSIEETYSLAIQLDFYVTMRLGELCALKWEDVLWEEKLLYVHRQAHLERTLRDDLTLDNVELRVDNTTKGHTSAGNRYIPLVDSALTILKKAKQLNPTGEYIFMPYGRLMNKDTFNRKLKKYCQEAKVPYFSSHKIRFTSASTIHNEQNIVELSASMGHSDIRTTLDYLRQTRPNEKYREDMSKALESNLNEA